MRERELQRLFLQRLKCSKVSQFKCAFNSSIAQRKKRTSNQLLFNEAAICFHVSVFFYIVVPLQLVH